MRTSDDPSPPPTADSNDWALQMETCRIELSRGSVASSFVARGGADGKRAAVCEPSTSFRWRGRNAPDTAEARLAHYELVARLKSEGWAKTGDGEEWYASEFTRSTLVPRAGDAAAQAPVVVAAPPEPPPVAVEPPRPESRPKRQQRQPDWARHAAAVGLAVAVALLVWVLVHG